MANREFIIQITKGTTVYSNSSTYATAGTTIFGITSGSMSLEQVLCSDELTLGECNSAKFEAQLFNLSTDVTGASIVVGYIEDNSYSQLFSGLIDSSAKDRENFQRDIIAYDKMYYVRDIDVASAWNGTSIWPSASAVSLKTIRNNLCSVVGLSVDSSQATLPNDSITYLPQFASLNTVKFSTLLQMICELQACLPVVTGNTIKFIQLGTTATAIDSMYDASNTEFEDYNTTVIDAVNIYSTSSDLTQTVKLSGVTTPSNAYNISGNIFILALSSSEITTYVGNVLSSISGITYNPASITMIVSDLSYSLGQKLSTTRDGTTYTHYVFSNSLSDSQLIMQVIGCSASGETLDSSVSNQNNSIIEDQKYSKLQQDIDSIEIVVSSKNKIWKQNTKPSNDATAVGDLWYVTGTTAPTGYTLGKWYYYKGDGVWEETTDSTITEHTATLATQATQIEARVTKTGGTSATFAWTLTENGFELTSNNNVVFQVTSSGIAISGSASIGSATITSIKETADTAASTANSALTNASTAQTTANSKIKTFAQTTTPTSGMSTGDIWIDTDDKNKMYRYDGTSWNAVQDGTIADAQTTANNASTAASNAQTTANNAATAASNAQSTANAAATAAANAKVTANQQLYYTTNSSTAPSAPTTWVTSTSTAANVWTTKVPTPNAGYKYYSCYQVKLADNTFTTSNVVTVDAQNTILQWCASTDTTKIDGGKIYANSVTADQIDATNLYVAAANITGTLTIGQLPSTVAETDDIPTNVSELTNDSGYQTASQVTTITEDTIKTTNVTAANLTVNAANITGTLVVKSSSTNTPILLSAGNNAVQIGNFTVTNTASTGVGALYNGPSSLSSTTTSGVYVGTDGVLVSDSSHFVRLTASTGLLESNNIQATGGTIGGWQISDAAIRNGSSLNNSTVGMRCGSNYGVTSLSGSGQSPIRFYAGVTDTITSSGPNEGKANFIVSDDGTLYTKSARIYGTSIIGNSTYSFTIGSSDSNASIYCGTSSLAGTASMITTSNNVYIGTNGFSYSTGATNDYTTVAGSGTVLCYGDASAMTGTHYRCIAHQSNKIGFYVTDSTKIGDITTLDSTAYTVATIELGNYSKATNFANMTGTWQMTGDMTVTGNIRGNSSGSIVSDANKKHDIEDIDTKYSNMFDLLRPRLYKYNDGTSGRIHTGFIAQELKSAMDSSDVDTSELAAYIVSTDTDGNTVLSIRYEEFVALNTWQIQKLKARVAELERKLEQ